MLAHHSKEKCRVFPALSRWLIALLIVSLSPLSILPLSTVSAESSLTIDSPSHGDQLSPSMLQVSGQYTDTYDVKLIIDGTKQITTLMDNRSGIGTGTWSAEIDTNIYHGDITLVAKGNHVVTRYGVTTPTISVSIDNPSASIPIVEIISPIDNENVHGSVPVKVTVTSPSEIKYVEVRINGGAWKRAKLTGNHFQYKWDAKRLGTRTSSIEARAIDCYGNVGRSTTVYAHTGNWSPETITIEPQDRAMWIWEKAAYNLFLNPGSRTALQALADDTSTFGSDPITTFYIGVFPYEGVDILEDQPEDVRDFVAWAHEHGYKVHACIAGGTVPPYYGALEPYHKYALREMEKVINYNLSSDPNEQFDGVNVDIEPYILPEFASQKPVVQLQYLDILEKMIQRRDTAGINLPFGPAIPRWLDSSVNASDITWRGQTKWLSEHVQDISDYISIMDYRDTADGSAGIIAQVQGEMAYANTIGKPNSVVLGVETLDIASSGDPETITFREEGRLYMEAELDKVYAAFNSNPAFGGIAMHHYDSIRWLPSAWGPGGYKWTVSPTDITPPSYLDEEPVASTVDYSTIELSYGRATDDSDIEEYIVYRGTEPGFIADENTVGGSSRNLTYRDQGLLPDTTYYYRVAAVDISGNIGPLSEETTATTSSTGLIPMIIGNMNITFNGTRATVTLKVVDMTTGLGIPVEVHGRFTHNGGRYVDLNTSSNGTTSAQSEALPSVSGQVGFSPQRIAAHGYYWASAYDQPHTVSVSWP